MTGLALLVVIASVGWLLRVVRRQQRVRRSVVDLTERNRLQGLGRISGRRL